tara:strand:+ start:285 stop:539 length:255 start_codon:yes stop_codon:yes gene_type:complete
MPAVVEAIEASEVRAKELGIKVHFMVNAAPKHVVYALLEAENVAAIALWGNSFPIKQDFDINPVQAEADLAAMAREMMARRQAK